MSAGIVQGNEHSLGTRLAWHESRFRVADQETYPELVRPCLFVRDLSDQPLFRIVLEVLQVSGRQWHEFVRQELEGR